MKITQAVPAYTGRSYLETRINRDNPAYAAVAEKAGAGTTISIGSQKVVITQRQGDGSYRTYFGFAVPADFFGAGGGVNLADIEATRRLLLSDQFYGGWADEYEELIRHSTDLRAWPLHSLSAGDMGWKSVPGLTLVGDAAHLSVPNGEGVNLAMLDALELVTKIVQHGIENVDAAVQEYETDMFPRGSGSISDGESMANVMFSEGPQPMLDLMRSFGVDF